MMGILIFILSLSSQKNILAFFQFAALGSTFNSSLFLTISGTDTQRREMVQVCTEVTKYRPSIQKANIAPSCAGAPKTKCSGTKVNATFISPLMCLPVNCKHLFFRSYWLKSLGLAIPVWREEDRWGLKNRNQGNRLKEQGCVVACRRVTYFRSV